MLTQDRRKAIRVLYEEGRSKREIARIFKISPKTVRAYLHQGAACTIRKDKKVIQTDILKEVYERCKGYVQRIHEVLHEDHGIAIGYSTLSRLIRHEGLGQEPDKRCHQVADEPGKEMQHDTTTHKVKLAGRIVRVICSGLYLRYSKIRFIKFYPVFNRFTMKCFFYDTLRYWGHSARICIVDNTNLAVLHGTGSAAVFNPEMTAFARPYCFTWVAHEKGHANRKAGKERNFWTIEQNFFPGRSFESLEDLNSQAHDWATNRYALRPQSKTRLIPIELFEIEKPYLTALTSYIEPPQQLHQRITDEYGYAAFNANYYWVPGKRRPKVTIVEYPDRMTLFTEDHQSVEYSFPPWGTRNQKYVPGGVDPRPYQPRNRKKPHHEEEVKLRAIDPVCGTYLDFIQSHQSQIKQKPRFIRNLWMLSTQVIPELFIAAIRRALEYHIDTIEGLHTVCSGLMKQHMNISLELPFDADCSQREEYKKGYFSNEQDPRTYQALLENTDEQEA